MLLRRSALSALALAAAACAPGVPSEPSPDTVASAVFDPNAGRVPLPNDLVLHQSSAAIAGLPVPQAQKDLLTLFQANGGYPNDQEVPVTIDFQSQSSQGGTVFTSAPDLDLTSFNSSTLAVLAIGKGATPVQLAPICTGPGQSTAGPLASCTGSDYVDHYAFGTLTLHNKNHQRWAAGTTYVVAVRGGAAGVKLKNGAAVNPSPTMYLLLQDKNLALPENQGLIALQLGNDRAAAAGAGEQLEALRQSYQFPLEAVDTVFPHREIASLVTFTTAAAKSAHVETDPGAGIVPLPSDFLLDPADPTHVANLPGAFGPLARGIASLDGFSTTAMILAKTSTAVDAASVTPSSVLLYKLCTAASLTAQTPGCARGGWNLVDPTTYETEPPFISGTPSGKPCAQDTGSGCFAPVIGLQPASPTRPGTTKPLDEATEYAVIITDSVHDAAGNPLSRSTLGSLLLFTSPLAANGQSNLAGVPAGQASALEAMRLGLIPALAQAKADKNVDQSHVAMAYTFRTQSITAQGLQLAALPYRTLPGTSTPALPSTTCPLGAANCFNSLSATDAFKKYGLDAGVVPSGNIGSVIEAQIATYDILDPATGAFLPTTDAILGCGQKCLEVIPVLIAAPKPATVKTPCAPGSPLNCAPLVVFHHGLGGGRADMLQVADSLTAKGFLVVAIDAPKYGDRSFCQQASDCAGAAPVCTPNPAFAQQGDAAAPGTCGSAGFTYRPVNCPGYNGTTVTCGWTGAAGIPVASGNFVIGTNFFRTRDTFRQDILDQSQLVRVLTPLAAGSPPQHDPVFDFLAQPGSQIAADPRLVYFVGQSLGAILGTMDTAANPRFGKVALNVGGGTLIDTFTNSPAFAANVNALLASIGISKTGTPDKYLQFISVAKWVLDPADPINWASHLKLRPLPNPLTPPGQTPAPMPAKAVIGQLAACDATVPNPFNFLLYTNAGLTPLSGTQSQYTVFTSDPTILLPASTGFYPDPSKCPVGAVKHGFLTSFENSATTKAQNDVASFFAAGTLPPPVETP